MTKNQTIELLEKQLSGFYSVEQVINLVKGIEEEVLTIPESKIKDLVGEVKSYIHNTLTDLDTEDVMDMGSASFDLHHGNEIVLESIDIDLETTIYNMQDEISDLITQFFEQYDGIHLKEGN